MHKYKEEVSTFVCKDDVDGIVHIVHLFVYPNADSNIFKSLIDGYGNFYIPNVSLDKPIKDQRFWATGKLLAIFDGRVEEEEVKLRLASTGFIDDNPEFVVMGCNRDGLDFLADTLETDGD